MNEIVHKISWERFCLKDANVESEKYAERLITHYSELLDLRNLNYRNVAPLLSDLPNDCLNVIGERLYILLEVADIPNRAHSLCVLIKLLCIIGRSCQNFDGLRESRIENFVRKCVDLSLKVQSTKIDGEWLELFEYLLYFLEMVYDPNFQWRKMKNSYYSDITCPVPVVATSGTTKVINNKFQITNEMTTWLITHLKALFGNQDIRNRLLHLNCSMISGCEINTKLIITPALIDIFDFNDHHINMNNSETIISYCCITSNLALLVTSERQEELSHVVQKLLNYLTKKEVTSIQDLRCLYKLVTVSTELSSEIIESGLLMLIQNCLTARPNSGEGGGDNDNDNVTDGGGCVCEAGYDDDENEDHELHLRRITFLLLAKLTAVNSNTNAKQQFLDCHGYNKLLLFLTSSTLQSYFLLDMIFTWAVNEVFDAAKVNTCQYIIRDGHVVSLLIEWGTSLALIYERRDSLDQSNEDTNEEANIQSPPNSNIIQNNHKPQPVVNWKAIFKLISELCNQNRLSIDQCCNSNVVIVICECIKLACKHLYQNIYSTTSVSTSTSSYGQRIGEDLLNGLFHLLQILLSYSVMHIDLEAVMNLFHDQYARNISRRIVKMLNEITIAETNYDDQITDWFELNKSNDCLSVLPNQNSAVIFNNYFDTNSDTNQLITRAHSFSNKTNAQQKMILDDCGLRLSNTGFSFTCWINPQSISIEDKANKEYERWNLFRVLSNNNNGFEAFILLNGQMVVASCHQGEYHYTHVTKKVPNQSKSTKTSVKSNQILIPNKWQMITIVFQNAKNLFSKSTVSVYVDNILINTVDLKYPSITYEPIAVLQLLGCHDNLNLTCCPPSDTAKSRGNKLTSLFSNYYTSSAGHIISGHSHRSTDHKRTVTLGDQESQLWGRLATLRCRLVSVACFNDVLTEINVVLLHSRGPMNTRALTSEDIISSNHLLVAYHALAYDKSQRLCFNLHPLINSSRWPTEYSAILYGTHLKRYHLEAVIGSMGGVLCLLPIVEQLQVMHDSIGQIPINNDGYQFNDFNHSGLSLDDLDGESDYSGDKDNFMIVTDLDSDSRLNESMLANLVILIHKLIGCHGDGQRHVIRTNFIPIMAALIRNLDATILDPNVVIAFHALADSTNQRDGVAFQVYEYILLDWSLWSQCSIKVRQQHATFLLGIIKHERSLFKSHFGIQWFLDAIALYHSPQIDANGEDTVKCLRETLFSIIYYLLHKHVVLHDYHKLIRFIHATKVDTIISETIELVNQIFTNSHKSDQDILLMYESNLMETLFVLLTRNLVVTTKEIIIDFLHMIITSPRVPDKYKSHLLLGDTSFAGLFITKEFCRSQLSSNAIQNILHILKKAASKDLFGVIQFISLITLSPVQHRIHALQMLKSFFDKSPDALIAVAKQPGWPDIIIHLLVMQRKRTDEAGVSDSNPASQKLNVESGFRRSSTWAFDESLTDGTMSINSKQRFDGILEEDGDEDENEDADAEACNGGADDDYTDNSNNACACNEDDNEAALDAAMEKIVKQEILENEGQENNSIDQESIPGSNNNSVLNNSTSQTSSPLKCTKCHTDITNTNNATLNGSTGSTLSDDINNNCTHRRISIIFDQDGRGIEHGSDLYEEELFNLIVECLGRSVWSLILYEMMTSSSSTSASSASSDSNISWMSVHVAMESLNGINERYDLLRPLHEIKQRIFISLIKSMQSFITSEYEVVPINVKVSHARELVNLIVDTTQCHLTQQQQHESSCNNYDNQLLECMMDLLQECLQIWDTDSPYSCLASVGFYYLLTLCGITNCPETLVAAVCARLHQIVCTSQHDSACYEEISFIIVRLDTILRSDINDFHYYFIAPVLKTVLERHIKMLQLELFLPDVLMIRTASFFDDPKQYNENEQWNLFVTTRLYPASEMYQNSILDSSVLAQQSLCRAQANERLSIDRKARHQICIDNKRRFHNILVSQTIRWSREETRRRESWLKEQQTKYEFSLRRWTNELRPSLSNIKFCPSPSKNEGGDYWRQSNRENYQRMRPLFEKNDNYSSHLVASSERDHPSCKSRTYMLLESEDVSLMKLGGVLEATQLNTEEGKEDQLDEEEWISIFGSPEISDGVNNNPSTNNNTTNNNNNKNVVFETGCKLIQVNDLVDGRFELRNNHFMFIANNISNSDVSNIKYSKLSHPISHIREVHLRRYNLRRSALEIFLIDQTNYFFNFDTKIRNKVYSKILSVRPINLIYAKQRSPADVLKSSGLTQKWMNREITNFEYLMQLNTISGRTYNDLSQYPIFPWILADYTTEELDLDNPATFRDLSKPIGVVNPKNEKEVQEKYDNFEDPNGVIEKFHYGTHYSSAAGVMHYLVRIEPFTTMHIQLQSGKFDVADRQFYSIPLSWNFIMESPNDNKELIPEFFYQPEFLRNNNKFDFGHLQQSKEARIDDVELPRWAHSPEDFIKKHRQALEADYVSNNLHNWIDLIFGYKQKGVEAVKALNVFYYVTYEGCVDLDLIQDADERESIESMINNFGQTPCQLLKSPHPRRMTIQEVQQQLVKLDRPLPVISNLSSLRHCSKIVCQPAESICYLHIPVLSQQRSFITSDKSIALVTVHSNNMVAKHSWLPANRSSNNLTFQLDVDPVFESLQQRRRQHLGILDNRIQPNNQLYAISPDSKFLISGGDPLGNLRLTNLGHRNAKIDGNYKIIRTPHSQTVCCVGLDIDSVSGVLLGNNQLDGTSTLGSSRISNETNFAMSGVSNNNNSSGNTNTISNVSPLSVTSSNLRVCGITGSYDGLVVVWDWWLDGSEVRQIITASRSAISAVTMSTYLDLAVIATSGVDNNQGPLVSLWRINDGYLLHTISLLPMYNNSSITRLLLTRESQLYVTTRSLVDNHQTLLLYSLYPDSLPIATQTLDTSLVTVLQFAPVAVPGNSSDTVIIVGSCHGDLLFLNGNDLSEITALRFQHSINDVAITNLSQGQQLLVALGDGSLILSNVARKPSISSISS